MAKLNINADKCGTEIAWNNLFIQVMVLMAKTYPGIDLATITKYENTCLNAKSARIIKNYEL